MIYFGGLVLGLLLLPSYLYGFINTKIKKPFGYEGKTTIPF
jgi:hypothetical protein